MASDTFPVPFEDVPAPSGARASAQRVLSGRLIPAQQQLMLYSSDDWEEFVQEWVHSQKANYLQVQRFSGAGDMGIDVAGFTGKDRLQGVWDNFQCKHYDHSLSPAEGLLEIAKVLWYSFNKHFVPPRRYYFMAPLECGDIFD